MTLQQVGDKAAIALSMLCVVHCLLMPVLLLLLPAVTGLLAFNDELFHTALLFFVLPISGVAMLMGYTHHRNHAMLFVGVIGLALLILAVALGHDNLGEYGEVALTMLGSSAIAYSHLRNLKLRRQMDVDEAYSHIIPHQ